MTQLYWSMPVTGKTESGMRLAAQQALEAFLGDHVDPDLIELDVDAQVAPDYSGNQPVIGYEGHARYRVDTE